MYHVLNNLLFVHQVAAEVSAPLAKTDTIVLLGDDRTTSDVTRLLANMTPAIQTLTGVDLSKVQSHCYHSCGIVEYCIGHPAIQTSYVIDSDLCPYGTVGLLKLLFTGGRFECGMLSF